MRQESYDLGIVGLGAMGKNLLLNAADHGFSVIGLDRDEKKVAEVKSLSQNPIPPRSAEMARPFVLRSHAPSAKPMGPPGMAIWVPAFAQQRREARRTAEGTPAVSPLCVLDPGHFISASLNGRGFEVGSKTAGGENRTATTVANLFLQKLSTPRTVVILVPAGPAVDAVIDEFLPHLSPGDLLIDAGNSHFKETNIRERTLSSRQIHFLGMGISGGEDGARHGASIMPGGERADYERVRPILEALAARVDGEPCVAYLGPGSAGHYVKMVHNGIEYGLMQCLAESYDLMRRGLGLSNGELHDVFSEWSQSEASSFLVEITARIFLTLDESTGRPLIDLIQDVARQKGTGRWASQDAMDLQVPIPIIDAAVAARELSILKEERVRAGEKLSASQKRFEGERHDLLKKLFNAYHAASLLTFAQGMALLKQASAAYGYQLNLETVARIWRGGCIIRSALLGPIRTAFRINSALPNLLIDPAVSERLKSCQSDLRGIVEVSASLGIPAPAFMAALGYYDGYRSSRLPANLIQAQRDYFGAHDYERSDRKGTFHTKWSSDGTPGAR